MDLVSVLLTIIVIALLVYSIMKKVYATTGLLVMAFIILFVYSLVTGNSIMGKESNGSWFLDIFEYMKTFFVSQYVGLGMTLMPIIGYAAYMNHIKASSLMASICATPLKKIKNPYIIVGCTVILGAILEIAIPSHTGLGALLMITVYPVLRACGVSKETAATAIILGGAMDLGPAAVMPIYGLAEVGSKMSAAEYFVNIQVPVSIIPIILTAVLCAVVNAYFDKKEGYDSKAEKVEVISAKELGVPLYYAFLPLLPIIFIVTFSKLVISSIIISVFAAIFLSFIVCLLIEVITHKDLVKTFDATKVIYEGMGSGYINIITLAAAASTFAGALQVIGGFGVIAGWFESSSLPAALIFAIIGLLGLFIIIFTGMPQAGMAPFTPSLIRFSTSFGVAPEVALLPMQLSMGYGRALSPIGPAVLTVCKAAEVDHIKTIRRNAIPLLVAYALNVIIGAIIL